MTFLDGGWLGAVHGPTFGPSFVVRGPRRHPCLGPAGKKERGPARKVGPIHRVRQEWGEGGGRKHLLARLGHAVWSSAFRLKISGSALMIG